MEFRGVLIRSNIGFGINLGHKSGNLLGQPEEIADDYLGQQPAAGFAEILLRRGQLEFQQEDTLHRQLSEVQLQSERIQHRNSSDQSQQHWKQIQSAVLESQIETNIILSRVTLYYFQCPQNNHSEQRIRHSRPTDIQLRLPENAKLSVDFEHEWQQDPLVD